MGTVLFTKLYAAYGPTVSTVVLTLVVLIFGEISPKSLAKEHAESFAMFSAPCLLYTSRRPLLMESVFSESAGCCKALSTPIPCDFRKGSPPGPVQANAARHSPSRSASIQAARAVR